MNDITGELFMKKSRLMLTGTAMGLAMFTALPAFAQDGAQNDAVTAAAEEEATEEDKTKPILVTGSRIARPTLESAVPLTSVTVDDLTGTGEVSLGDALNDLPSLRSTFSSGNSSRFIGTAGLSLLDLRGLGTDRTLVLVNGRRHVTSSPGSNGFDVNTVPSDLIDRIDIVTGGNSAVYGSDAVAGVVNFILKKDFDGLTMRGQGGISSRGDRGSYFASITGGRNFGDGRGNIALSAEYTRQQPLLNNQRDALTGAYSGQCRFQLSELTTGEPAAGNGTSDTTYLCGLTRSNTSGGGTIGTLDSTTGETLRFDQNGNLFFDVPERSFIPFGSGNLLGGKGSTTAETGSLLAAVDRYSANMLMHYDISDALRPFVEAKFVRTIFSGEGSSSFFNSVNATFGGPRMRCNNGFLTAQALATLQDVGLCGNVAAGTFPMSRTNTDLGARGFSGHRDTFRVVGGVEGDFNDDWKYEVALNYGRFKAFGRNTNNVLLGVPLPAPSTQRVYDGFNLAVDAIVAPVGFTGTNFVTSPTGQKVICRVNGVTNTRPDCVPLNIFGEGNADPRALKFSLVDGTISEAASQFVASANISGDFSQLFELLGGPIAFALGTEYRSETGSTDYDQLTNSGASFLNKLSDNKYPKLVVKEVYGELQVPLLKNLPFAKELVITAAGRLSNYNNSTGTVYAYNLQGIYAPINDVHFRVAYATSVRAPDQSSLFASGSQNFANGLGDPCTLPTPGSIVAANCAAAGVPATANAAVNAACVGTVRPLAIGAPWQNCLALSSGTPFLQGGNPTLQEERGKSLTLGAVFEPSFLPGFSLTVDYYDIKVKQAIALLGAQTIVSLCYGNTSGINNQFCATVNRDPATGFFLNPAVISGGVNFASLTAKGIDVDVAYRRTFDNGQKLAVRFIGTRVLNRDNFTDPSLPNDPNRQLSELGDPEYTASLNIDYDFGDWDVRWSSRYIGRQTIGSYEAQNSFKGLCPASGSTTLGTCTPGVLTTLPPLDADAFPRIWYPDVFYHDIRLGFDVAKDFRFYAGISNIFDRQPPFGLRGTAGGDPFDSFGRNFFAGFEANF
jgi:outer membrane receptor protein involved in Fe transport